VHLLLIATQARVPYSQLWPMYRFSSLDLDHGREPHAMHAPCIDLKIMMNADAVLSPPSKPDESIPAYLRLSNGARMSAAEHNIPEGIPNLATNPTTGNSCEDDGGTTSDEDDAAEGVQQPHERDEDEEEAQERRKIAAMRTRGRRGGTTELISSWNALAASPTVQLARTRSLARSSSAASSPTPLSSPLVGAARDVTQQLSAAFSASTAPSPVVSSRRKHRTAGAAAPPLPRPQQRRPGAAALDTREMQQGEALHSYKASFAKTLSVEKGDALTIRDVANRDWWWVETASGQCGWLPPFVVRFVPFANPWANSWELRLRKASKEGFGLVIGPSGQILRVGSAARGARFRVGYRVVGVDGVPVGGKIAILAAIGGRRPGDEVRFRVTRSAADTAPRVFGGGRRVGGADALVSVVLAAMGQAAAVS
jgi:hypothetical protein